MSITDFFLNIGVTNEKLLMFLTVVTTLAIAVIGGVIVFWIAKKWLAKIITRIAKKTDSNWDDLMFDNKFFNRLGLCMAPIVIMIGIDPLEALEWRHFYIIDKTLDIWLIIAMLFMVDSILEGANRIYESYPISKDRPMRIIKQVVMLFLSCVAFLIIIGIITQKEIGVLLTGLAAFAAVLMLVFKDSILGFTAGIQLANNNMLKIDDWIEMPSANADGFVTEIGLISVKVQNWDKTITTIPTYNMVSQPFTNWRGMQESGGRRIKRSINIDVNSIHYLTDEEFARLRESSVLKDYIDEKLKEINEYNSKHENMLDTRRLTNIGTFREYLERWIKNHPDIRQDMLLVVRQLQPGPTGVPIEIYCFSGEQRFVYYEHIQADIFDHIYAVLPLFGLQSYQYTTPVVAGNGK